MPQTAFFKSITSTSTGPPCKSPITFWIIICHTLLMHPLLHFPFSCVSVRRSRSEKTPTELCVCKLGEEVAVEAAGVQGEGGWGVVGGGRQQITWLTFRPTNVWGNCAAAQAWSYRPELCSVCALTAQVRLSLVDLDFDFFVMWQSCIFSCVCEPSPSTVKLERL